MSIDCTVEDIETFKNTIEVTEGLCKRLIEYVDELGLETLKSCGFQESKINAKYLASVGMSKLEASPAKIQKYFNVNTETFMSLKEVKDKLQMVYERLKIKD